MSLGFSLKPYFVSLVRIVNMCSPCETYIVDNCIMLQVGGVHFNLLSKVRYDIGDSCSLDYLIDSIFPLFRKHIEPDIHHAQVNLY